MRKPLYQAHSVEEMPTDPYFNVFHILFSLFKANCALNISQILHLIQILQTLINMFIKFIFLVPDQNLCRRQKNHTNDPTDHRVGINDII